jgi:hypothetical protein
MRLLALLTLALAAFDQAAAADPPKQRIELRSEGIGVLGLPLAESEKPVYRVLLTADVGANGEGSGVLACDVTEPPDYDRFGFVMAVSPTREIKLDCALKPLKTTTRVFTVRDGPPGSDKYREVREDWHLYAITGPKITSKLFLVMPARPGWTWGRLLVQGPNGKVKYVIDLALPPQPEPCHPGCFPAGTAIRIPGGTTTIERVKEGDIVITVGPEGQAAAAKVEAVFVTRNQLMEVRTEGRTLLTTKTQPLALEGGQYRPVSDLKPGDRVWRWSEGKRLAVPVLEVRDTAREAQVFNLVLGAPTTFIAGEFLARSKPPADVMLP